MKNSKLKRNLIIIFSVIIILAIIIIVLYNITDIFRTKRSAFFRYFNQIENYLDVLEMPENYKKYEKTKQTSAYTKNGEMTINNSKNIADESILSKIKLTLSEKTDPQNEKSNTEVVIKSLDRELFSSEFIRDKNIFGFYEPQIADGYITLRNENLTELAKNMEIENADKVPSKLIGIDIDKILNLSEVEEKHIESYIKMIRNNVADTAYSREKKVKINIEGKKYETTAYTLTLNPEQNSSLQIDILEKMKSDSIMMNLITSKCKLLNMTGFCIDINSLNKMMQERIQKLKNNPELAGNFTITLYEYKQKNIQTKIVLNEKEYTLSHLKEDDKETVIGTKKDKELIESFELRKENEKHILKYEKKENDFIKVAEFAYNITGSVEENNVENHLTIKIIDDIKEIEFNYNDKVNFTNSVGLLKSITDEKTAVINDYEPEYAKEFVELVKKQINNVYINQGASIGINLEPIFN